MLKKIISTTGNWTELHNGTALLTLSIERDIDTVFPIFLDGLSLFKFATKREMLASRLPYLYPEPENRQSDPFHPYIGNNCCYHASILLSYLLKKSGKKIYRDLAMIGHKELTPFSEHYFLVIPGNSRPDILIDPTYKQFLIPLADYLQDQTMGDELRNWIEDLPNVFVGTESGLRQLVDVSENRMITAYRKMSHSNPHYNKGSLLEKWRYSLENHFSIHARNLEKAMKNEGHLLMMADRHAGWGNVAVYLSSQFSGPYHNDQELLRILD